MKNSSCLMLATSLYTGIDLSAVFEEGEIERDTHFTVFYDPNKIIPSEGIGEKIKTILGEEDYADLIGRFKSQEPLKVMDYFGVGHFDNQDFSHLILRLHPGTDIYDTLQMLNSGLQAAYSIKPTFPEYTPHMTLASMSPGKAKDYVFSGTLGLVLEKATFTLDDFILGYGDGDKTINITTENAVDRFFRQLHAKEDRDYYNSL